MLSYLDSHKCVARTYFFVPGALKKNPQITRGHAPTSYLWMFYFI